MRPSAPTSSATSPSLTVALADSVDRTCPNPSPPKPEYRHYYLSPMTWPSPDAAVGSHFWLSRPLPGSGRLLITEWFPYGYDAGNRYLLHNGIDIAEPMGTPLLAAANGTVVVAGDDYDSLYGWRCDWYGNLVVIELEDRWQRQPVYVVYGHVQAISVEPGEQVFRGQQVAEVGVGGAATLPHLHFEVRVGTNEFGSTRNPLLWIELPVTRGTVAGRLVDPEGRPWQGVDVNAVGLAEDSVNRTTWTYLDDPQHLINPDEGLAENFVLGDLPPGQYELIVHLQGETYSTAVEVFAGQISTAEIVTSAFKTPTPSPTEIPETTPPPTSEGTES